MKAQRGYTIVEMLIFLAVSGAMFTVAFFGTARTRNSVALREATNSIELKIREVFNNVDNGYFQNAGQYRCALSGDAPVVTEVADSSGGGNSGDCVYLGKHIGFSLDGKTMIIDTIIGNRTKADEAPAPLLRENYTLPYDMKITNNSLFVEARRARNATEDSSDDLRATREPAALMPVKFCFNAGDASRNTAVIITQKDITVDYNGVGC